LSSIAVKKQTGRRGFVVMRVMRLYWPKESALNGSWKPPGFDGPNERIIGQSSGSLRLG
jgi:hypothetical protein